MLLPSRSAIGFSHLQYRTLLMLSVILLLLQNSQMTLSLEEGDSCVMNGVNGVCATACKVLETGYKNGKIKRKDFVHCGYTRFEEIICCPVYLSTGDDQEGLSSTTTPAPTPVPVPTSTTTERLQVVDDTSTAKPDFWLHLLTSTTTTTTTTTTPTPLVYKGKELDADVEYIDLNSLLQNNNNNRNRVPGQTAAFNNNANGRNNMANGRGQGRRASQQMQQQQFANLQQQQRLPPGLARQQQQHPNNGRGPHQPSNGRRNQPNPNGMFVPQEQHVAWPNNEIHEPIAESHDRGDLPTRAIFPNPQPQQPNWQSSPNPIAQINDQLIKAGMDIVEAKLENVERQWGNQQTNFQEMPQPHVPAQGFFGQNPVENPAFGIFQIPNGPHQNQPSQGFFGTNTPNEQFQAPGSFGPNQSNDQFQLPNTPNQAPSNEPPVRSASTNPFLPFEFRPSDDVITNDMGTNTNSISNGDGDNTLTVTSDSSIVRSNGERPSIAVCKRIESKLGYDLSPHILDGIPAERGEFPHAALIQFSDENLKCGGALIEQRFILTAAHCVINTRRQPIGVRLGMVHVANTQEGEEFRIKRVHIHPDYSSKLKYNDIALLELDRDAFNWDTVDFEFVGPACLYTSNTDPPPTKPLIAIGWGLTNVTSRTQSERLLKVELKQHDTQDCDRLYREQESNGLPLGITDTQICAFGNGKDACAGDSGGPLNVGEDIDRKYYQIVGIVSTGFSCGTNTPGLYTRVSAFLDYVESVVWPVHM